MDISFSQVPEHALQTNHVLRLAANLYRLGFLVDESRVWAKVNNFEPQVWTLTDRSSLTHYHAGIKAGCVRITKDRIRWAPTVDGSNSNPILDIDLSKLDADHFTLVVDYCETGDGEGVTVIENSTKQPYEYGDYRSDNRIRIIDGPRYWNPNIRYRDPDTNQVLDARRTPPENATSLYMRASAPNEEDYQWAHALVRGVDYLSSGMTKKKREALQAHLNSYSIRINKSGMDGLVEQTYTYLTQASDSVHETILDQVDKAVGPISEDDWDEPAGIDFTLSEDSSEHLTENEID